MLTDDELHALSARVKAKRYGRMSVEEIERADEAFRDWKRDHWDLVLQEQEAQLKRAEHGWLGGR